MKWNYDGDIEIWMKISMMAAPYSVQYKPFLFKRFGKLLRRQYR
jgi:hypothetical protein